MSIHEAEVVAAKAVDVQSGRSACPIRRFLGRDARLGVLYSRFLAKALPEEVFRYSSKSRALCLSANAMAVLIRQGLYLDVWGLLPWLWDLSRDSRFSVKPM